MIMTEEEMDEQLELMKEYDSLREDEYSVHECVELIRNCADCSWNSANNDE